jgi:glycosyltransferase involved in cell wall biosynthesis
MVLDKAYKREQPLRIVTFSTLYPSASQPNHGIFVENRLRHLVANQDVVAQVVAPVPWFPWSSKRFGRFAAFAGTPRAEVRFGLPIVYPRYPVVPKIGMTISPAALFLSTLNVLWKIQQTFDFDLIDAHYFYPDGVAAAMLGAALRKPVVITARGTDVNYLPRYILPRKMIKAAADRAANLIAVSQSLKNAMVEIGIDAKKITVLRNGVDLEIFRPMQREFIRNELGVRGRVLASVGQLIERKGHHLVIEALASLKDSALLIAGNGPDRARLADLAKSIGVADRVRFLGSVPHGDLVNIYNAADVSILASSREGWPNVLLESMACGTPVVATPIWGNPEIVSSKEAGVLSRERSASAIAQAIEALFCNLPERSATRAFAEAFSWDETSSGQMHVFEGAIARYRSRYAPAN